MTMAIPRIIQLNPGQPIFRWVNSKVDGSWEQKACGPWWSTKRGAQQILELARSKNTTDTSEAARWFSSVARSWGSDLKEVVCAMVVQPIKAFLGVGREIYDKQHHEVWDSQGLQLYIPNMSEKKNGTHTLSRVAKHHVRIVWVKQSHEFEREMLDHAMAKGRRLARP